MHRTRHPDAILKDDPEPLSGVAPGVPAGIVRVAAICLEKRPEDRFESARDVVLALETLSIGSSPVVATVHRVPAWRRALRLAAAVAIVAALGGLVGWRARYRPAESPLLPQYTINDPAGDPLYLGAPAVSPDGRFLAYVVDDGTLEGEVRIRPLGSLGARTVRGTTGAGVVHWSPDSRLLMVRSLLGSKLWKVPLDGGPPQVLAAASGLSQLGWDSALMETGTVLYTAKDDTIWRMDAWGGSAKQLTTLDTGAKEWFHGFPQPLPDGRHFLLQVRSTDNAQSGAYIAPLDGGAHRLLLRNTLNAVYADPGYVLFAQAGGLVAQRFDVSRLGLIGEPISLGLAARGHSVGGLFASPSTNGTLVTASAEGADARFAWVDRRGAIVKRFDVAGRFFDLSLSPSGSTLALNRRNKDTEDQDVWTMDLDRGVLSRLTSSPGNEWVTSWSPDGRTVAFTVDTDLFRMPADGSGPPVRVRKNARLTWATDWSPDGRFLLGQELTKTMGWNVIAIALDDPESSMPIATTGFDEQHQRLSANGKWLAYTSNESGRNEVYLQPFPSGGKTRVSADGGAFPRWRRDGRELYYVARDASLIAVSIDTSQPAPRIGEPQALFTTSHPSRSAAGTDYVPSADGQRFLVTIPAESSTPPAIIVTVNWPELPPRPISSGSHRDAGAPGLRLRRLIGGREP